MGQRLVVMLALAACGGHSAGHPDGSGPSADADVDTGATDAAIDAEPAWVPQVFANVWGHNIALDDANVYWTGSGVMMQPKNGTTSSLVSTYSSGRAYEGLAVTGGHVYWATLNEVAFPGKIWTATPGSAESVFQDSLYDPRYVTVDATSVIWATDHGLMQSKPFTGGALTTVASTSSSEPVTDGVNVYFLGGSSATGEIDSVPVGGGTPTRLAPAVIASGLALRAGVLYWKDCTSLPPPRSCSIFAMPTTGGTPTMVSTEAPNTYFQSKLAVDADNIYWTDWNEATVWRAPLTGGAPILVASNQRLPDGIAVDDTHVYWTTYGGGAGDNRIMRCHK